MKSGIKGSRDSGTAHAKMAPAAARAMRTDQISSDAISIDANPLVVAQRQHLSTVFGQAIQRKPKDEEKPVQMQLVEDASPLRGHAGAPDAVVQRVGTDGTFHGEEDFEGDKGFITVSVDNKNLGHTYIIGETKDGAWMYHFSAAPGTAFVREPAKLVSWTGVFEEIKQVVENGEVKGRTPQEFVGGRSMLHTELKVTEEKVNEIKGLCENEIGEGTFSLIGANLRLGDNCISKVYNILVRAGVTFKWDTYILSFLSPRLALSKGSGLMEQNEQADKKND